MLLKFIHTTLLDYSEPITESVVEVRMAPRQESDQHRLSFELAVGPRASVNSYFDWLGNTVHTFTINPAHREIRMVATSVVETDRQAIDVTELADRWPLEGDDRLWDYLQFSGPVVDSPVLRQMIQQLEPRPHLPLGELAIRMLNAIHLNLVYEKGITTAASPITDALEHRKGVCQDFAHIMIGLSRALGIPARYVSGLVHPINAEFRGFTQTHAWCELFFPSTGWIAFDPTNHCVVGPDFVKVAVGRDFRDVAPNRGVFRGAGKESMTVTVSSEVLNSIPRDLFAERYQVIQTAVTIPESLRSYALQAQHQDEQQQQQQQ